MAMNRRLYWTRIYWTRIYRTRIYRTIGALFATLGMPSPTFSIFQ